MRFDVSVSVSVIAHASIVIPSYIDRNIVREMTSVRVRASSSVVIVVVDA